MFQIIKRNSKVTVILLNRGSTVLIYFYPSQHPTPMSPSISFQTFRPTEYPHGDEHRERKDETRIGLSRRSNHRRRTDSRAADYRHQEQEHDHDDAHGQGTRCLNVECSCCRLIRQAWICELRLVGAVNVSISLELHRIAHPPMRLFRCRGKIKLFSNRVYTTPKTWFHINWSYTILHTSTHGYGVSAKLSLILS